MDLIMDDYALISPRQIGRGRFASVYKGQKKDTGEIVALKVFEGISDHLMEEFKKEYENLFRARHPNIVAVIDAFVCDTRNKGVIVLQYCEGDSLEARLDKLGVFDDREAARVIRCVATALAHCHSLRILHRDVKPADIMYLTQAEDSPVLLGDFGASRLAIDGITDTPQGTRGYKGPEMLLASLYGPQCDIWSVGAVAYELLHGERLFKADVSEQGMLEIMRRGIWTFGEDFTPEAADFITGCLAFSPDDRPTAAALLNHPWLQ
jgi:calcium/calmodulin-dependent protein kinase I